MSNQSKGGVYLLHFDTPYQHARHYIGFAIDIDRRIDEHRRGCGARLMAVIKGAGIGFTVAKVWHGEDRKFERRLKNWHGAGAFCPVCRANRECQSNQIARCADEQVQ
jgi:predicted GIY-YIG superfamily endonuclease